jgi:siroheme synthase-like protein
MAALFPIFVKLEGRKCVLVGAGTIATQKLQSLLDSGANLHVIAPAAISEIQKLARAGRLTWTQTEFQPDHLQGASLVIAATGDPSVNQAVYQAAQQRGVLCNSVDEPERCDFYYPALVRRGDLQIAISTAGKSPALAQRLRKELEEQFDSSYIAWLDWLGTVRELFFKLHVNPELRRQTLHRISGRTVFERFKSSRQRRATQGGDHD